MTTRSMAACAAGIITLGFLGGLAIGCQKPRNEEQAGPAKSSELRSGELATQPGRSPSAASGPREVIEPKDPMKAADGDMKKVLEQMQEMGMKPIASLSPVDARKQPTPADAVVAVLKKEGKSIEPRAVASVQDKKIATPAVTLDARVYIPKSGDAKKPRPVILYFHGGGWVLANLDTYDASARALADEAKAIVLSADYRHAPEAKFPAAHEDAFAAYQWVLANAASLGGDPRRIAVAGESAGGNLAINVSMAARDRGLAMPVAQLLVYPVASMAMDSKSYQEWANAKPLDRAAMKWFGDTIAKTPEALKDKRLDLVNADLHGLPRTSIVLAEIDPLRSEGDQLGDKLEAAGVKVSKKVYEGVTHEFFGMGAVVSDAKDAEAWAGDQLEEAFESDGKRLEKKK
jgi:acetyl esterase